MKKIFTSLMFAALLLVSGSVKAQFTATLEDSIRTGWTEGSDVTFNLAAVATQMKVTTAQLIKAFDDWTAKAGGNSNNYDFSSGFFMLENSNVSPTFYSEQYGGFEMDKDGNFSSWNNGSVWGVYIHSMNAETNELAMTVCQNPSNPAKVETTCHGTFSLNLNGGQATFYITFTIHPNAGIDKEPVTDLSLLTIVGETSIEMQQEPNTSWYNYEYSIATPGIAEALGTTPEYMESVFDQMVYAKSYDMTNEQWGDLTNEGKAVPAPGFYFSGGIIHIDSVDGKEVEIEDQECRNAVYQDANLFWICNIKYSAATDSVTCYLGQYPNGMSRGETRKADIYIVYGENAYIIHYTFTVDIPKQTVIGDLTKVGETTWTVTDRDPQLTWNTLEYLPLDLDSIAALFTAKADTVITPADITFYSTNSYSGITNEYTADNSETTKGFWMNNSGVVGYYNNSETTFYINYINNDSVKALGLGNKPDTFDGGETITAPVYLVVGDSLYYAVNLNMTIMQPKYTIETCNITEYDMTVRLVPSTSSWQIGTTPVANLEQMIWTSNAKFYGVTSSGAFTNAYSVSEATTYGGGGFWMSPEDSTHMAYAAGYSGTGAYAMWYYESTFTWFTIPNFRKPGETSYGTFYLANLWTGDAVKVNVTLKFVDKIVDINPIGTEEVDLAARNQTGDDFDEISLDLSKACEELVCTEEELLSNGVWKVVTTDGELSSDNFDDMYGFSFNADGEAVANAEDAVFQVGFIDGALHSFVIDDANTGNTYKTVLYVEYNNKLYGFNIVINNTATAINNVKTNKVSDGIIYDLTGRKVSAPTKGIYIINGEKVFIK